MRRRLLTIGFLLLFLPRIVSICIVWFQSGVKLVPFSEVIKMGNNASGANSVSPRADDTAIIMYTSGSTGVPKGVLLSHKNILSTLKAFCDAVEIKSDDVFLGFLPLAHVFELLAESVCLLNGVPIGYSTPLTLIDSSSKIMRGSKGDASVLHPTCLTAVPVSIFQIGKWEVLEIWFRRININIVVDMLFLFFCSTNSIKVIDLSAHVRGKLTFGQRYILMVILLSILIIILMISLFVIAYSWSHF